MLQANPFAALGDGAVAAAIERGLPLSEETTGAAKPPRVARHD